MITFDDSLATEPDNVSILEQDPREGDVFEYPDKSGILIITDENTALIIGTDGLVWLDNTYHATVARKVDLKISVIR